MSMKPPKQLTPKQREAIARYNADRHARFTKQYPTLAPRKEQPTVLAPRRDFSLITLGADDVKRVITIDERARLEHSHVIGATGSGKSTFLFNCIVQDIARGRGAAVLDPHGGHPDSLVNQVLRFLSAHGWFGSRKVHILSPNIHDYIVGFNPLAPLPDTDLSVISDALLKAFERAWGSEDTHQKPTIRTVLKATFMALAECRMTIPQAKLLYDRQDRHGLRARVLSLLQNEYARDELDRLHQLSLDARARTDFDANVIGPINRLNEFVSSTAIAAMLGMTREQATPDNTLDLLEIMNRGDILLVDLQHGRAVSEADTDLLGKILTRYFFLLMTHRRPLRGTSGAEPKYEPFFLYIDECHRYLTEDIPSLLAEARKYSVGVTLAHQYLAQLGKPGEPIYEALKNSTQLKVVFRINSAEEAQVLAHDMIPLDLEMPVQASIRPTPTGYEIRRLKNETYAVHEGEGEMEATHAAEAIARGDTTMQNWMQARSHASTEARSVGTSLSSATGSQQGSNIMQSHANNLSYSLDPSMFYTLDPAAARSGMFLTQPLGMNLGTADASATANLASTSFQQAQGTTSSETFAKTEGETEAKGGGRAFSDAVSQSKGASQGKHKTRGTTTGTGSSDTVVPVYKDLPTSYHSKDNVLYMAGERIRELPTGRAVVRFKGKTTFINVPFPRRRQP